MDIKIKLFILFVGINVVDTITTVLILGSYGFGAEVNPIIRSLLEEYGWTGLYVLKVVGVALIFLFLDKFSKCGLIILNVGLGILISPNIYYLLF